MMVGLVKEWVSVTWLHVKCSDGIAAAVEVNGRDCRIRNEGNGLVCNNPREGLPCYSTFMVEKVSPSNG